MTEAVQEKEKFKLPPYVREMSVEEYNERMGKINVLIQTAVSEEVNAQDVLIEEGEVIDFKVRGRWVKQSQLDVWEMEDIILFLNKVCGRETLTRKGMGMPFTLEVAPDWVNRNKRTIDTLFFSGLMNDYKKSYDFSAHLNKVLRVHVCSAFANNPSQEKAVIAIRLVPNEIPDLDTLNLPSAIADIHKQLSGICIISGHTGAGKSTTGASIIKKINTDIDVRRTILTVEDPIEFVHESANGRVIQRQLRTNVLSYEEASVDVVRESVDVVYFGEIKEVEGMHSALRLAEMGKLVVTTMHSNSVADTVDRFVGEFSPDIQESVRSRLLENLVCILHQNLKVYNDKQFPVASALLVTDDAVRQQLRNNFSREQINALLKSGQNPWAISTEKAFQELLANRVEGLDEEAETLFQA
ncbi:hypothetical protein CN495_08865 [Bacillus thuringiensis]|uniref:Bacterial type II secretion system protein E domain-containing protein n=1 Tax=Bacillus thuringiensis TaxID=1428 RepID=A0ABD6SNR7_BACTU|nr:ATPase, T2SS/T4P/T4SS family [Bacillus thuringiensis]PER55852.1 hypothetical protein CN495_08865 [Bacillus thuringiensis]